MTSGKKGFARNLLASAVLLAAWTPLRAQDGGFAYVANRAANNVSAYRIHAGTGALTAVSGSPFVTGQDPRSVAVDPTGQFAYVPNRASATVSAYRISATTGALTPIPGSPFPAGAGSVWVTTTAGPQPAAPRPARVTLRP